MRAYQRADGAIAGGGEEGDEGGQRCADAPGGLPVLGVVRGDGQADLGVGLEAAIGREHQEAGRLEGVLWREQDAPMVDATLNSCPFSAVVENGRLPSSKEALADNSQAALHKGLSHNIFAQYSTFQSGRSAQVPGTLCPEVP